MAINIIKGDITKLEVDAIVNAANSDLLGGDGVDGAIHSAAGFKLLEECKLLGGCNVGEAKITKGYDLKAKYVIHTVGPIWQGGAKDEENLLRNCYLNSLMLAKKNKVETIAFPLISSGVFGYPKDKAMRVAMNSFETFLEKVDMDINLVIYDSKTFELSKDLYSDIKKFIGENYVDEDIIDERRRAFASWKVQPSIRRVTSKQMFDYSQVMNKEALSKQRTLRAVINEVDDTFSETLLRLIDEKGMTDVAVYKKANIDRKLFSKIRSNKDYQPSKVTAIAFAIALSLNIDETIDFIGKAGFTLSMGIKFDLIIRYFIERENHNIHEINEALFAFDQILLGV